MNTTEVANRLVELCRVGEFEKAMQELYSPNIVSLEPAGAPMERCEGIQQVIEKAKGFAEMTQEFHSNEVSDPVVGENFFSCSMAMDITMKGAPRMKMEEVCVYQVKDGKIVQEQFFFTPQQQG